jgi:two-component system sensor histidine kinase UhpB
MRYFSRFFPVDRKAWRLSLHTRVSLVLTALAASLLLVLAALWLRGTEAAIHEEVEEIGRAHV